jgi:hypothetical protein
MQTIAYPSVTTSLVYKNEIHNKINMRYNQQNIGARGSVAVKALFYKPEGRRFETR